MEPNQTLTVFWSWQSESPKENRSFILSCIEAAAKQLGKTTPWIIEVDRDTKGVAGTPAIAETILSKIVSADVVIWDATLIYDKPRPAPNPNVLFELGYALAVLGESRIIGVMNIANGRTPDNLPFDLVHRRWPIQYSLPSAPKSKEFSGIATWVARLFNHQNSSLARKATIDYKDQKKLIRDELTKSLKHALELALSAPKTGAVKNDVDLKTAQCYWQVINSALLHDWYEHRSAHPMYEDKQYFRVFDDYVWSSKRPENEFQDPSLKRLHNNLVIAINTYHINTAREMQGMPGNPDRYILSCKIRNLTSSAYDIEYDRQKQIVWDGSEGIWQAWKFYINELKNRYPEVIELKKQ